MKEDWVNELNLFTEPQLRSEILKHGKVIQAKPGDVLIKEGQHLNFLPIVIHGKIRVYQQKDDREILLYYVGPQETCMMSLSAAYMDYNSAAFGMATEDSEILILPAYLIADWQLKYPSWNQYIIRTYKSRYDELLNSFGSVAFKPIALRLKDYLLSSAHTNNSKKVFVSHQTLANELGTTRVVISRILKQFEKEKILKLGRGYMELV
ncbi:MAG TPA: Crp/Fnr family transcriptional regulator [Chryseolinea sp.]